MSDFKRLQIRRQHLLADRKRAKEEKIKKSLKSVGYSFKTTEDIQRELAYEKEEMYRKIPKDKKQAFLDLMHSGRSIGQAREELGLSSDEAFEIFNRHMITGYIGLEKTVKE